MDTNRDRSNAWVWLAVFVLIPFGCGPRPGTDPTAEVSGVVKLDGEPIDRVSVAFIPESGRPASGMTDEEGRFTLTTFDKGDGAILGSHTVVLNEAVRDDQPPPEDPRFFTYKPPPPRFPVIYGQIEKTPFKETVNEGDNEFEFDMKSEP